LVLAHFFDNGRWGSLVEIAVEGQGLTAEDRLFILMQAGGILALEDDRRFEKLKPAMPAIPISFDARLPHPRSSESDKADIAMTATGESSTLSKVSSCGRDHTFHLRSFSAKLGDVEAAENGFEEETLSV